MSTLLSFSVCVLVASCLAIGCRAAAYSDPLVHYPNTNRERFPPNQFPDNDMHDAGTGPRPNIIVILADDMGWDDISMHGSDQIPTGNIDAFHTYGIGLHRHYTAPMCTPTRSSLLTGRYPSTLGMQNFVIGIPQPWGLGLDQKLLPQYLKEVGYSTHLVGKWHAGFYTARNTPPARGFDTFFGCYGGAIDYYNHSADGLVPGYANGFDIRDQWDVSYKTLGRYSTDLFTDIALERVKSHVSNNVTGPLFLQVTYNAPHAGNPGDPLQAPSSIVKEFAYIKDAARRKYAAMVTSLDRNIGRLIKGLDQAGMLDNSVVLWFADNGSPVDGLFSNSGSNFPQRGQKDSPWDGGAHNNAAIWSPLLKNKERISNDLLHVTDWLPTLAHVARAKIDRELDGHNQWETLSLGKENPRTNVLINRDQTIPYTSYVSGHYKYVNGTTDGGTMDGWLSNYHNRSEVFPNFNHSKVINESPVGQVLKRFSSSPKSGISAAQISKMREQCSLTCNLVPREPTDPRRQCRPLQAPCLFDIVRDPCERDNLATVLPGMMTRLEHEAQYYESIAVQPRTQPNDPRSNPTNFDMVWTRWFDLVGPRTDGLGFVSPDERTF